MFIRGSHMQPNFLTQQNNTYLLLKKNWAIIITFCCCLSMLLGKTLFCFDYNVMAVLRMPVQNASVTLVTWL